MAVLIDKGILLAFGIFLAVWQGGTTEPVAATLFGVIAAALGFYIREKKKKELLVAAAVALCFFLPSFLCFLPVIFYECAEEKFYWGVIGVLPCLLKPRELWLTPQGALWGIASVLAVFLAVRTGQSRRLEKNLIVLRDNSTELNLALEQKNKDLMEKQDYEISLAVLKERNRIAREIHDNVGHMLSRSILQMGALLAVYPEDPLHEQLAGVSDTLNQAMNSIRESVHDLHEDSIDLKQVVSETLKPLETGYQTSFDYDMGAEVPREVKYCFIMIVKEAVSNILKHSNASKVSVTLREHPAFYQLCVEDNGKGLKAENGQGIGLINMRDRVEVLEGTFRIDGEQGVRIFASVPKKRRPDKKQPSGDKTGLMEQDIEQIGRNE